MGRGVCIVGFQLESLGGARQAGERFLSTTVAPEGSGREAQLLSATERCETLNPKPQTCGPPPAWRAPHALRLCTILGYLSLHVLRASGASSSRQLHSGRRGFLRRLALLRA